MRHRGMFMPCAAGLLLFVILIPLPPFILDFLLTVNIMLSFVVLVTVFYLKSPLEFSSFPSLLLAMTLLRLVLNTATTRLILSNGSSGTAAAGHVVETFGYFVAGGSLAVGVIIFIIIMVIQFVVITKGATRIAEVAARFTLDGMPGKQMAIDADLNAGIINESEAKRRRDRISSEADFYGAMDGASKFVRGDAIAGLVITFVNVLGGLYVGMVEDGMGLAESLKMYTTLTIGDGLASQIPAFILSIGAGMLVTRGTGTTNMGEEVMGQLFGKPVALGIAAVFLGVLAFTPLPKFPLLSLGGGCAMLALAGNRSKVRAAAQAGEKKARERAKPEKIETNLKLDALELQIGFGLVRLVDRARGGDLLDRIASIRKQTALDMGLVVPPIRIRDNSTLEPNRYAFLLRGQEIATGELYPDQLLAMNSGVAGEPLGGVETTEPAFGLPAYWIDSDQRQHAERLNYTVVEPTGVLATHLTELVKRHAAELLTRGETNKLIENLKERNAALVEEVIPTLLKVGEVQKVLQNLLGERVPIRDLEAILETLGDWAPKTKDIEVLTEYARHALARTICSLYRDSNNTIHCVSVDPGLEDYIQAGIQRLEHGSALTLPPNKQTELALAARKQVELAASRAGGAVVAVVCSPQIRMWVRRMLEPVLPQTPVLALNEIVRGFQIQAHGVVNLDREHSNVPSPVVT
ncbi:MAG: flagellar biosynthesis protein FlhA [Planctomycetes bacterium]|nr:flagellar biosynthesis protein FlhA [Planctomycetota bacterium]